jgi:peptide/nickel transport system permease protein
MDAIMQGEWDVAWDAFSHIILPASLLGYFSMAYISRMTRNFMLNELGQEYVVAARERDDYNGHRIPLTVNAPART